MSTAPTRLHPVPADTPPAVVQDAPIATPTHGAGGSFSVACSTRIAAPPAECLRIVLDAPGYPEWNRFCRACNIEFQPDAKTDVALPFETGSAHLHLGTRFVFDVHMDLGEPVGPRKPGTITGRATPLEVSVLRRTTGEDERFEEDAAGGVGDGQSNGNGVDESKPSKRKGWLVAWKTRGMPGMVLRSERVQGFFETADGSGATDYVCWETFYGVLAPVVRMTVGTKLERGFGAWMEDLKRRAESLHETTGG